MEQNPKSIRIESYRNSIEFKLVTLQECPIPFNALIACEQASHAVDYWNLYIRSSGMFNADCECLAVLLLNARRRIKGHQFLTIGTMDTILVHPREIYRIAILAAAHSIIVMHNHPSGDPSPSEEDIRTTRELIRAGQLIKIQLLDHIIVGGEHNSSLRELGYF